MWHFSRENIFWKEQEKLNVRLSERPETIILSVILFNQSQEKPDQGQEKPNQSQEKLYQSQNKLYQSQEKLYESQETPNQSQEKLYQGQDKLYQGQDKLCCMLKHPDVHKDITNS